MIHLLHGTYLTSLRSSFSALSSSALCYRGSRVLRELAGSNRKRLLDGPFALDADQILSFVPGAGAAHHIDLGVEHVRNC